MGAFCQPYACRKYSCIAAWEARTDQEISAIDDKVDILYEEILSYLGKVGRKELTESQAKSFQASDSDQ